VPVGADLAMEGERPLEVSLGVVAAKSGKWGALLDPPRQEGTTARLLDEHGDAFEVLLDPVGGVRAHGLAQRSGALDAEKRFLMGEAVLLRPPDAFCRCFAGVRSLPGAPLHPRQLSAEVSGLR